MGDDFSTLTGRVFGGTYELVRVLGQGGMGAVFEATNIRLGKKLAVKVLSTRILNAPDALHRFHREAKIATDLGHPHVVDVVDFNETEDGIPYIVMEYLDGEDFAGVLARSSRVAVERVVSIVRQVCWGLDAAHRMGIVHRDLKPENVFLCRDKEYEDYVKIVDFGISKVLESTSLQTHEAAILGTPYYMAPEQAERGLGQIGVWTDVYAVGAILYRALGDQLPFHADSLPALLYEIVHKEPQPIESLRPDLPAKVPAIVGRAMAKSPRDRYPSVRALSLDLLEALSGRSGLVREWEREGDQQDALADTVAPGPSADGQPAEGSARCASTMSAAASEVVSKKRVPATRWWTWAFAVSALAGVTALVLLLTSRRPDPVEVAPRPASQGQPAKAVDLKPDGAPASEIGGDVGAADTAVLQVTVRVHGKPKGARVVDLATGEVLATIPGKFSRPRFAAPIKVKVVKRGYRPAQRVIVFDKDQRVSVRLRSVQAGSSDMPFNPHVR